MRRSIPSSRNARWRRETPRQVCGLILTRCRRGSGEREPVRTSGKSLCYTTVLRAQLKSRSSPAGTQCSKTSLQLKILEVDFSRALTYPSACSKNKSFRFTRLIRVNHFDSLSYLKGFRPENRSAVPYLIPA